MGSGQVVLVHGFASQARFDGENVMLPLARKHRVIVPECGHAASIEKPKEFLAAVLPFLD